MPSIEKLSIALPAEMAAVVRGAVDAGEYSSNSEVVRDALRDWTHKRRIRNHGLGRLRQLWQEAVEDESDGLAPELIFQKLKHRYDTMAAAQDE